MRQIIQECPQCNSGTRGLARNIIANCSGLDFHSTDHAIENVLRTRIIFFLQKAFAELCITAGWVCISALGFLCSHGTDSSDLSHL